MVLRLEEIGLSLFALLDPLFLTPLYGKESVSRKLESEMLSFKMLLLNSSHEEKNVISMQIKGKYLPGFFHGYN